MFLEQTSLQFASSSQLKNLHQNTAERKTSRSANIHSNLALLSVGKIELNLSNERI